MDSGLGSDEDRSRSRTKEQKQLRNQQLLSGCFIDAASLSDDADVDLRRSDERRQGSLVFQNSIPQFSMLQMPETTVPDEADTPYNSIVETAEVKSPLGFYVDLSEVPETPKTPVTAVKKNIFSMVIDFEGPKKEKPVKLSSSLVVFKKKNKLSNGTNGSLSSSVSSICSSVAGPSRQIDDEVKEKEYNDEIVMNMSISSKSSSSSENEKNPQEEKLATPKTSETPKAEEVKQKESNITQNPPQFVKLSDLECQKPSRVDLNFTPRMSKSIPESSWVESPLLMSRSAGYRSAPHPLEPDELLNELSDSGSGTDTIITNNNSLSQPRKSVQRLGTDLLRMFLEEIGPDVIIEVDGHKLKAHKCILASRCQYFAALLSGNWLEASGNVISLQGFSYESVYFALCHIYSGAAHVPDSISLVELASLADMLGLEGLKEVVEHALKQRHCHNFHKPCAGCCTGILEVLPLSAAYGLDDLYQKCLQWITQHFIRVWPSRAFATLPRELREKCYQQHVIHMNNDKVLETIAACDKILTTLPQLRWAEPVQQLVLQLSDACHLYHRQHFSAVLASHSFLALDTGLGWSVGQIEEQLLTAAKNLSVEQACRSYARICKMIEQQHNYSRPFNDLLFKIKMQLEQCLVGQADRLIRSNAWLRLDSALRCRIKDLTPVNEPVSRLPRKKKTTLQNPMTKSHTGSSTISSSDSSRNSSPSINQTQSRLHNSNGSPSLRRSLLLAAKAPQVPPSPTTHRRSTLTQPTASSAAKSAPVKTIKNPPVQKFVAKPREKPIASVPPIKKPLSTTTARIMTGSNVRKAVSGTNPVKKTGSRSNSPMKIDNGNSPRKLNSKVTSPSMKCKEIRTSSPAKKMNEVNEKNNELTNSKIEQIPIMQRSSTFLKDEPTILTKIK